MLEAGVQLGGKARENLAGQITASAERIASAIGAVLGVALAALALAAGALIVSVRAFRAAGA